MMHWTSSDQKIPEGKLTSASSFEICCPSREVAQICPGGFPLPAIEARKSNHRFLDGFKSRAERAGSANAALVSDVSGWEPSTHFVSRFRSEAPC